MSPLRHRMIEDLQLAGMSEKTLESYVRSVRQLVEYCGKSPDQIDEEEIRSYFLHVKNDKKWARATCTIAISGMARVARIVMYHYPNVLFNYCESSGRCTGMKRGYFLARTHHRHSYATHLLEAGVNLRQIQTNPGHNSPATTSVYTHLTGVARDKARQHLDEIMNELP